MHNRFLCLMLMVCAFTLAHAQQLEVLSSGNKTSLRGLSAVSDKVAWVSGSHGSVALTIDSGKTWKWLPVAGYEKRDFRDIEAFDAKTAIMMAVDTPAIILKTTDAGLHWKKV